jgi:phosphoribosyl 1,2-cyclic phosphate phosphodiesterase
MDVIFLGTGTSQGVPMIACDCAVCTSTDPRNKRSRTSVHVVMDGLRIQVDSAPEFRLQCIQNRITKIELFLLTHGHADHIAGMDDLRRFCDLLGGEALEVYSSDEGIARVLAMYPYAILERPVVRGYPAFKLRQMPPKLELAQGTIESTLLPHGGINTLGLIFTEKSTERKFAYYTDCNRVPREGVALAKGADLVVLDGLRQESHPSHMSIREAVAVAQEIGAKQSLLTHMTHSIEHAAVSAQLPQGVGLAYDGLKVELR